MHHGDVRPAVSAAPTGGISGSRRLHMGVKNDHMTPLRRLSLFMRISQTKQMSLTFRAFPPLEINKLEEQRAERWLGGRTNGDGGIIAHGAASERAKVRRKMSWMETLEGKIIMKPAVAPVGRFMKLTAGTFSVEFLITPTKPEPSCQTSDFLEAGVFLTVYHKC